MATSLKDVLRTRARQYILHKLYMLDGNKAKVAKASGVGLSTLYRKMKELDIKWRR